jgi:hypothetical protein
MRRRPRLPTPVWDALQGGFVAGLAVLALEGAREGTARAAVGAEDAVGGRSRPRPAPEASDGGGARERLGQGQPVEGLREGSLSHALRLCLQ